MKLLLSGLAGSLLTLLALATLVNFSGGVICHWTATDRFVQLGGHVVQYRPDTAPVLTRTERAEARKLAVWRVMQ